MQALIGNGISCIKENGVTAMASLAEACKEKFQPFFGGSLQFLAQFLSDQKYLQPVYKQFSGQVIEALTMICAAVGKDAFAPHATEVINLLIQIQSGQLDAKDPQRPYVLSAW